MTRAPDLTPSLHLGPAATVLRTLPRASVDMVAALHVQADGCYAGLPGVDTWPEARDARLYAGPHPIVAHPDCKRWGRYATGSPRKPGQYRIGDDERRFETTIAALIRWGGVLEHPAESKAWNPEWFNLPKPPRSGGWVPGRDGTWCCYVEQGHYGHFSRKPTWLCAVGTELPDLIWGEAEQRLHPIALERHGYAKARRIGMAAMIGGKDKTRIREATPIPFRDVLLGIARSAWGESAGPPIAPRQEDLFAGDAVRRPAPALEAL